MKRILLVFSLLLGIVLNSQAQIILNNQTGCDFKIWVVCIDQNCNIVNETPYVVNAGTNLNVPRCTPPLQTYFIIQSTDPLCPWSSGLLSIVSGPPPHPCTHLPTNSITSIPTSLVGFTCPCAPAAGLRVSYIGSVLSIL